MPSPLLRLSDVRRHFGGVRAVDGVSLDVAEGAVCGLIGPNGAGKTTLVNLVTGYLRPDGGSVSFAGQRVDGRPPHAIAGLGVARTFQNLRLYRDLTAVENVVAGMHANRPSDTLGQVLLLPGRRRAAADRQEEARRLLALVGLDPDADGDRRAATLAYGDQRRLEIARALALRPRFLVLDEPSAGMNPAEKDGIRSLLADLRAGGLTVLLIDHDMRLVMSACDRLAVLDFGRLIAEGAPQDVAADPAVLTAYLGTRATAAGESGAGGAEAPAAASPAAASPAATSPAGLPTDGVAPAEADGARAAPLGPAAAGGGPVLLEAEDLDVRYGAVRALEGVSFSVAEGEVVALIGGNGAGKSTALNTLSGLVKARAGRAAFAGLDLLAASPSRIVGSGLVQVPEGREILARLTVRENLELGAWCRRDRAAVAADIAAFEERFPILGERRDLLAGQLSGGEQQVLAIVRGLVARPRMLLLDEPSLGLAPRLVETIFEVIEEIHADGITVLLVEQNAYRALELASRAYVLETGRVILAGPAAELRQDPGVQRAYLGG
ncbi:MAG: ATP-binding cassette domain-containing protein [Acidimicrobiales bacterium]